MTDQLFPLLCGLATVSFTACIKRPAQLFYWLGGLLACLSLTAPWPGQNSALVLIEPTHIATVSGLAAWAILHKSQRQAAALALGGVFAALWIKALASLGLQWLSAATVVGLVAAIAALGATRIAGFAPRQVRDEALLLVIAVSAFIALVPTAIAAWQTSSGLQAMDSPQHESGSDTGAYILSLAFMVLGGLYAKWKYR